MSESGSAWDHLMAAKNSYQKRAVQLEDESREFRQKLEGALEKVNRRALGFAARPSAIFNGQIIAQELVEAVSLIRSVAEDQ